MSLGGRVCGGLVGLSRRLECGLNLLPKINMVILDLFFNIILIYVPIVKTLVTKVVENSLRSKC